MTAGAGEGGERIGVGTGWLRRGRGTNGLRMDSWSRWFMVQVFRRTSRRDSVALASSECTVLSRPRFLPDGLKSESLVKKPASKSRKVFWGVQKSVRRQVTSSHMDLGHGMRSRWRTNLITNSHITNPSPSRGKTPARIKYYWYTALDVTRNLNLLRACSTGVYNSRIHSMKLRSLGANPQTLRS